MKSELFQDKYYIECACGDPNHMLSFDIWEWVNSDEKNIDIYFTSNYRNNLWGRIKSAFKFIFFKEKFLTGDSIWITSQTINQLEEIINEIKKIKK